MGKISQTIPSYLKTYKELWDQYPKKAALQWFKDAQYGLFIHYGLYSQLGTNEHAWRLQDFSRLKYEKLKSTFKPENFDAE